MRAALRADYDMNVNHKLFNSITSEHGLYGGYLCHGPAICYSAATTDEGFRRGR
ncbi:MAG: hypothetical protein AB7G47_19070 [Mycolicibacterium sp.]|uniref:hypothetical protein n=1 Tax=Mycolicibacterium sp. TaxID=2320850 RepID=UPI003D0D468F